MQPEPSKRKIEKVELQKTGGEGNLFLYACGSMRIYSHDSIFTVVFSCVSASIGFHIRGGGDQPIVVGNTGIFITKVREGGLAHQSGKLSPGDRILEVRMYHKMRDLSLASV